MLKPLEIPSLTAEELEVLEKLYRTTKDGLCCKNGEEKKIGMRKHSGFA